MESERSGISRNFVPTLGLVGIDGSVRTTNTKSDEEQTPENGTSVVSEPTAEADANKTPGSVVSAGDKFDENVSPNQINSTVMEFTSSEIEEVIKRPRLTLLILKEPSNDNNDYVVANAPESDSELLSEYQSHKKKKKKKKSKEKCLTMSRSYAQKLVEIQKSMLKLTSKYQPEPNELELDRRRRTQSASYLPSNDGQVMPLKSPPLSAPVSGQIPSFLLGSKAKHSMYRRRYISASSNTDNKRRFTRKKRSDLEETSQSTSSETAKKNHLSENNVWTPMDDYRLLVNITKTKGNLEHVFAGTKFSCFYTFDEVAHRWETLLYDDKAGVLAQTAINNLHPVIKTRIQTEALFSEDEENLLRTIRSTPGGTPELSSFTKLLEENPQVFQHRTARKLFFHWQEMKNFHLLDGQDVRDYKDPFNLFEFQDNAYLTSLPDMAIFQELRNESRLVKHQIRQLEEEIESWHCMQELVVSDGTSDLQSIFSISEFDDQTFAVLRGKQVRYCMRSKEILVGRNSTNNKVDADLTLEGASGKVSRRQAIIKMREFGDFYIINQGRQSIFVDNVHVPYGGMAKLSDGCVIQITHIKLIFKINDKLMRKEILHEVKKEVINARLKSFDSFSSSFPSVSTYRQPGCTGNDILSPRYSTPRKRNSSSASSTNSPVLGLGSPFTVRPSGSRSTVTSTMALGNNASLLPFSSNGDLTIRPISQPLTPSPFLNDTTTTTKHRSKSLTTDGDVFKKPAPVSSGRAGSSKSSSRYSNPPSSSSSSGPSAFSTVVTTPVLHSSTMYTTSPSNEINSEVVQQSYLDTAGTPASLPSVAATVSQLIDYTKLGLSADVTVTQRASLPTTVVPVSTTPTSVTLTSTIPSEVTPPTTTTPSKSDEITTPMPSLGLVKVENTNS